MKKLIRVHEVEPLHDFVVCVTFTNDEQRAIDLTRYIERGPIFEPVRSDAAFFRAVHVAGGTIAWPNGADIDPDVLYYDLGPHATEEQWRAAIAAAETVKR